MSNRLVRIHLKLDSYTSDLLQELAVEAGMTQTKLLRRWLRQVNWQEDINDTFVEVDYDSLASFYFRLEAKLCNKIEIATRLFGLGRNQVVKLLVMNAASSSNSFEIMRGLGDVNNIQDLLCDIGLLINQGQYRQAIDVIDQVEYALIARPRNDRYLLELSILRSRLLRHQRHLSVSYQSLSDCLEIAKSIGSYQQMRECLSQLSVLDEIQDRIEMAIARAELSVQLDYEGRAQARLLNLYALQLQREKVEDIIALQEREIDKTSWSKQRMIQEQRIAMAELRIGKLGNASDRLKQVELHLSAEMQVEYKYNCENQAVIDLSQGKLKSAYSRLRVAEGIDANNKGGDKFSKAKLFRLFIESSQNFDSRFAEMREMVELQTQPVYVSLGQYVTYSSAYIHGGKNTDQKLGKRKLEELSKSGSNAMLRQAAGKTLKDKILQTVI